LLTFPDSASLICWSLGANRVNCVRLEEARKEAAEVLRINPRFTIESYKRLAVFKDPKDVEHRLDGLRKAGLPEV
jgi:adenylate cyclase